jgi:hypothetical protein
MRPWVIEAAFAAASFAFYFAVYGVLLLVTRPAGVRPGPSTQDLGPEKPAIASLVANGWELTEDAAEATLLDLGGRRILEFRQPGSDPRQTTIHIVQTNPSGLNRYEQRVFDRVSGLSVGGVVPLSALTFRDEKLAKSWWKRLRAEIVADARALGLSQRRFSSSVQAVVVAATLLATGGVLLAVFHYAQRQPPSTNSDDNPYGFLIPAGLFTFFGLLTFGLRYIGERSTPAGVEAASRWLGVKAFLRSHDTFSDLPPSAVAVWDRYLGYGAALGTTRVASTVIDMGMGNKRRVWSSYGGNWRRVRVSYPSFWWRYGRTTRDVITRSLLALGVGFVLVRYLGRGVSFVSSVVSFSFGDLVTRLGVVVGVVLLGYGSYLLVRGIVDVAAPKKFTGQVLWKQVWRKTSGGENRPSVPWLYHLAIDDGSRDKTRAWGAPSSLSSADPGDTVTVTVHRWSRRIMALTVDEHGSSSYYESTSDASTDPEKLVSSILSPGLSSTLQSAFAKPAVASGTLLTADEVSAALGMAVVLETSAAPGPMSMTTFRTTDRHKTVLMLQVVDGTLGAMAWRTNSRGQSLPSIGDGAFVRGNRGVVKSGGSILVLTLLSAAKGRSAGLPTLLSQAVARIPSQRTPSG